MIAKKQPLSDAKAIIELGHVAKYFGPFRALTVINFTMRQGEKVVVCGPSGLRKTTMIRCINQLKTHDAGVITVDGIELV